MSGGVCVNRPIFKRRRTGALLVAGGLALALVAAACGSDDSGSSAGTTAAGGGAATTAAGGAATTAAAAAETPVPGGKLVMGIEADTGSPWEPSKALLAISGHTVIRSIFDSLTIVTDDGKVVPYLAESVTPNADYTVWTIKVRSGVTFHDGTPLNVGRRHRQPDPSRRSRSSPRRSSPTSRRTRTARPQIAAVDDLTVAITMTRPWVPFPLYLSGAIGYMASPTWQAAADKRSGARVEARRHRSVRLQGLQAGRVVHRDEEPELLEQAVPVPRRGRVPRHPRRAHSLARRSRPATSTSSTRRTATRSRSTGTSLTSSR